MEDKKNNGTLFFRIIFVLFIAFLCLYSISQNGYVERVNQNKTLYTEEQIKQFESDIANGKEIDVEEYLKHKNPNYANNVSNFGEKISNLIEYGANKSIETVNNFFSYLFE